MALSYQCASSHEADALLAADRNIATCLSTKLNSHAAHIFANCLCGIDPCLFKVRNFLPVTTIDQALAQFALFRSSLLTNCSINYTTYCLDLFVDQIEVRVIETNLVKRQVVKPSSYGTSLNTSVGGCSLVSHQALCP